MPIKLPTPPQSFERALRDAVGTIPPKRMMKFSARAALGANLPISLRAGASHRVYSLGLEDAANAAGITAAEPVAWRAFLADGDDPVALGEAVETAEGVAKQASLTQGPLVRQASEALARAERSDAVVTADFELRFLTVPSIYVSALWLHGASDLFVPVLGANMDLQMIYPADRFFAAIQPAARRMLTESGSNGAARV